jgi:hypothetical protein
MTHAPHYHRYRRRNRHTSAAHAAVQTVEADNGEVYRVMQTIHSRDGTAQAQIATPDKDVMNFLAGRIAQIACGSVAGH